MNAHDGERLTATEAAAYIGCSRQHLYNLRTAGTGPASYKVAGKLAYDRRDLDVWLARQRAAG
jgi:predicted DNA-binding transcriptional regulator AlpA